MGGMQARLLQKMKTLFLSLPPFTKDIPENQKSYGDSKILNMLFYNKVCVHTYIHT